MTTETESHDRLARLGDALDRAVRADLAAHRRSSRRIMRHPRRLAAGAALAVVVVPAAAFAATQLITTNQVAASLPQGTKALIGTDPTCNVVTANVEYHCVLANAPTPGPPPQLGTRDRHDGRGLGPTERPGEGSERAGSLDQRTV